MQNTVTVKPSEKMMYLTTGTKRVCIYAFGLKRAQIFVQQEKMCVQNIHIDKIEC